MFRLAYPAALAALFALSGCEAAPSTSNPGPAPPHGGGLVAIPGGAGFVEVVKQGSASGGESNAPEAAFYFYKDAYTPYSPAPTSGTLSLDRRKVDLKPEGNALVTPPGQTLFKGGDIEGTLTVGLGGKTTSIPLGLR